MSFTKGQKYSRRQISRVLGGSAVRYLPWKGGRILCGCFRNCDKYNPGAPEVVTIGAGRDVGRSAAMIARQKGPIPVFVCDRDGDGWEYRGTFECYDFKTDVATRESELRKNPARKTITGVLYFRPAA